MFAHSFKRSLPKLGLQCPSALHSVPPTVAGHWLVPVYTNSKLPTALGMPTGGCVTLPDGIYCNISCNRLKTEGSRSNPKKKLLDHEGCHVCALQEGGLCAYIATWGDDPDECVNNEVPTIPLWN